MDWQLQCWRWWSGWARQRVLHQVVNDARAELLVQPAARKPKLHDEALQVALHHAVLEQLVEQRAQPGLAAAQLEPQQMLIPLPYAQQPPHPAPPAQGAWP